MLSNEAPSILAASRDNVDDAKLLGRVGAGDRAALEALYRAYHKRLVRFFSRFTRRDDVLEEVLNDTFFVAWRKASSFRGEVRVSIWLMGIAYRVTIRSLRDGDLPHEPLSDRDDSPRTAEPSANHELIDWMRKGLSRLSAEQRLVMELAYVMGHSLDEIAEITELPVATVKARMFHARVKLRNVTPALTGWNEDV